MKLLTELITKTKGSLTITINGHRDCYETVEEHLPFEEKEGIDTLVLRTMIEKDLCMEIQFYPDNPISFYIVYHYDLEEAIKMALKTFKKP